MPLRSGPAAPVGPRSLPQVDRVRPPPFLLPAEHFVASLGWLAVAGVLVPASAPRLAAGNPFDPVVFASLHVLTLGVITSAIFGALSQFVPGGLEVPLRSVRLGHAGFWLLQAGAAALVFGFLRWSGPAQAIGWILLSGAVVAAAVNFLPARRSAHGSLVGWFLLAAHSALGAGMLLAAARIGVTLGWWQVDRLGLLAAHLDLGAIGWGTLTVFGVGSRMLPTFLLSRGDDTRRLHLVLGSTGLGLALQSIGTLCGARPVTLAGVVFLVAGGGMMIGLGRDWFRRKNRPLDPSLYHVASAFVGLAASIGWGLVAVASGNPRLFAAYGTSLVLGWLVLMVIGVEAKIMSHLSYIHLFRKLPGLARVGDPNRLLRRDLGMVAWGLLSAGGLGLPAAIAAGLPRLAVLAGWVWSAGVTITLANYARAVISTASSSYPRPEAPSRSSGPASSG